MGRWRESTRRVKDVTEALCGTSFSTSTVSHLAAGLDPELRAWRSRPLEADAYPYVFVDARYQKVRADGRVVGRQGVLIVSCAPPTGCGRSSARRFPDTGRARRGVFRAAARGRGMLLDE
jgi:hypothetical protein